jgi:hypothetical protein
MTEEEIEKAVFRFDRRYKTFLGEGLCDDQAYKLAEQMYNRDLDPQDDRRVCFECSNYIARVCTKMRDKQGKPQMPLRFILQRCEWFDMKGKK